MPFVKMQQFPGQIEKMIDNGEITAEFLQLTVAIPQAAVNNIGVKGGLQIVHQHFKAPDFHLIDLGRHHGGHLRRVALLVDAVFLKLLGDI